MRVTLFDYGAGNLHSLAKALATPGVTIAIAADPADATATDLLVLPGVGAFGPASAALAPARDRVRGAIAGGMPCIGICLGMQLLFDSSEEGEGEGLGVISGSVRRLRTRRQPHMGWNTLEPVGEQPLLAGTGLRTAYFAHSFACAPDDPATVAAWTRHDDDRFASIVRSGAVLGVQFHPEKSSAAGVAMLRAVVAAARAGVA